MRYVSIGLILITLAGCQLEPPVPAEPAFIEFYRKQAEKDSGKTDQAKSSGKLLTISTQDMPLTEFLRWLSNETAISVVCGESIDKRPVTVDIVNQGIDGILSVVARRLGVQVTRTGNLYYLGDLRIEDKGVLVRRVSRLRGQEIIDSVTVLLSENGRVSGYDDGLVIVGDKVEILQRVSELLDGVENAPSDSWFVQLFLLNLHNDNLLSYGVDLSLDATIKQGLFDSPGQQGGFLTAAIEAAKEEKFVSLVSSPFFVLADGASAVYVSGQNVPIPRKSVSSEGTVTTTGYEFQQTGLQFKLALRQVQQGKTLINIFFESSSIVGYVEAAPITLTEKFESSVNVQAGRSYLVGSVRTDKQTGKVRNWFRQEKGGASDTLQIWCRAYKID